MRIKALTITWNGPGAVTLSYEGSPIISDLEFTPDDRTAIVHFAEDEPREVAALSLAGAPADTKPWVVVHFDGVSELATTRIKIAEFPTRPEAEACIVGLDFVDRDGTKAGRYAIIGPSGPVYP